MYCVGEAGGSGVCKEPTPEGDCWEDDDCGEGEECAEPSFCPCDMDCDMAWDGPGVCKTIGFPCADMTNVDFGI
jgi:hypothetical protein